MSWDGMHSSPGYFSIAVSQGKKEMAFGSLLKLNINVDFQGNFIGVFIEEQSFSSSSKSYLMLNKVRGANSRGDSRVGFCYRSPPDQDKEVDEAL